MSVSMKEIEEMIKEADDNGDGEIDFGEFSQSINKRLKEVDI